MVHLRFEYRSTIHRQRTGQLIGTSRPRSTSADKVPGSMPMYSAAAVKSGVLHSFILMFTYSKVIDFSYDFRIFWRFSRFSRFSRFWRFWRFSHFKDFSGFSYYYIYIKIFKHPAEFAEVWGRSPQYGLGCEAPRHKKPILSLHCKCFHSNFILSTRRLHYIPR